MNKTTGLTISQLKIIMCVGTKAQDEKKCIESQQNLPWAQVQYTIFSVTDFVPTDRKNLSSIQPNLCVANLQNVNFCSQPCTRYAITKATEYIMLSFSFPILVSFPF